MPVTVCTAYYTLAVGYGPALNNADTALNKLIDVARDQSGKKYMIEHYATRIPPMPLISSHFWSYLQVSLYISYVSMNNDNISLQFSQA